jgi:hypothetical protein
LVVHAAAVAWKGKGLLLPGPTGVGKSTLAAWLTTKGFAYLTDELAYVPHGSLAIQGLPRPLHLRKASRAALESRVPTGAGSSWLTSEVVGLFQPIQRAPRIGRRELAVIVFPRYRRIGTFQFVPVSKARAGLLLMECLLNARNLPDHGFEAVTALVQRIPSFELAYTSFDELESWPQHLASAGAMAARSQPQPGGRHGRHAQEAPRQAFQSEA